jgi:hypothetical protein
MTLSQLARTPLHLVTASVTRAVAWPGSWPITSQQHARRNALVASTALSQRRREAEDVEEFLARHAAPVPWAG